MSAVMERSTIEHLYRVHGELTKAFFLRGLTAAERRRIARVRRLLDTINECLGRWRLTAFKRKGRARRLAIRKHETMMTIAMWDY